MASEPRERDPNPGPSRSVCRVVCGWAPDRVDLLPGKFGQISRLSAPNLPIREKLKLKSPFPDLPDKTKCSRGNLPRAHSTTAQTPCVVAASRARTSPRVSVSRLMSIAGVGLTTFTAGEPPASCLFIRRQKPQPYAPSSRSLSTPLTGRNSVPNRRPLTHHQGPTRPVTLIRGRGPRRTRSLAGTSRELPETHRRPKILVISSLPRGEPTPELPSSQYPPRRIIGHAIGH